MKPQTDSDGRSAPARQSTLLRWIVFGGVGVLLLSIILFRVYLWHKTTFSQGNATDEQRPSLISPVERGQIDEFRGYLNSLSKLDPNAIQQGETFFHEKLLSLSSRGKDMAFLVFSDFYYFVVSEYNEKSMDSDELMQVRLDTGNSRGLNSEAYLKYLNDPTIRKQDPQIQTFTELLSTNGLKLVLTKKGYFIHEKPGYLYDHFGAVLSEALRTFLELRRDDETVKIFSADGDLVIPYRDLGEKIILWERFLDKYPDSLVIDEANYYYQTYLDTMIAGTPGVGTPNTETSRDGVSDSDSEIKGIFDENGVLKPELKRVYYNFKSKYPNTKSGKLIDQFYDLLLHNNFKRSRQVEDFYRENQIKPGGEG